MSLVESVETALESVQLTDADQAVVELVLSYARALDASEGRRLATLGPALLRGLEELHLTPKARAAIRKEAQGDHRSPLDELRARRTARIDGTAALDSPTS